MNILKRNNVFRLCAVIALVFGFLPQQSFASSSPNHSETLARASSSQGFTGAWVWIAAEASSNEFLGDNGNQIPPCENWQFSINGVNGDNPRSFLWLGLGHQHACGTWIWVETTRSDMLVQGTAKADYATYGYTGKLGSVTEHSCTTDRVSILPAHSYNWHQQIYCKLN